MRARIRHSLCQACYVLSRLLQRWGMRLQHEDYDRKRRYLKAARWWNTHRKPLVRFHLQELAKLGQSSYVSPHKAPISHG